MTAIRGLNPHFRLVTSAGTHGNGRRPEPEFVVDPAALEEWNRGTRRAIRANRDRETRERFLDSLYYWREFER